MMKPCTADLFRLAERNATVGQHLEMWRHGQCSWDECLISLSCWLAAENQRLMDAQVERAMREPIHFVVESKED